MNLPNTMKALRYDLSVPKYLLSKFQSRISPKKFHSLFSCMKLRDVTLPKPHSSDWVLIKVEASGICGSDLGLLSGKDSFSMEPYSSFPAVLGHESVGKIVQSTIPKFPEGQRVAIDGTLPCVTREIDPKCNNCKDGNYNLCDNFREGSLSAGPVNGYNASVGGSFAEYMIAHKSQLFPIPDNMPLHDAILIDALASSLQPVAMNLPKNTDTVLVYGAGIIGLLIINAIRALGSKAKIILIARYPFQISKGLALGADHTIGANLFENFSKITGAKLIKPSLGKPVFEGGVDMVFDCVGSSTTIDNSLRFLKSRGKYVLVGASGMINKIDTSPIWFKELQITGSSMYSNMQINKKNIRTYQAAIDLIKGGLVKSDGLVTHKFKIQDYKKAFNAAMNKKNHKSIKVAIVSC